MYCHGNKGQYRQGTSLYFSDLRHIFKRCYKYDRIIYNLYFVRLSFGLYSPVVGVAVDAVVSGAAVVV